MPEQGNTEYTLSPFPFEDECDDSFVDDYYSKRSPRTSDTLALGIADNTSNTIEIELSEESVVLGEN